MSEMDQRDYGPSENEVMGWREHYEHEDENEGQEEPEAPDVPAFGAVPGALAALAALPPPTPVPSYWSKPDRPRIPTLPYPEIAYPVVTQGRALGRCEGCGMPVKLPGMGTMDQPYAVPQHVCKTLDACSFCGVTPSPARPIVMGPGVGICRDCVELVTVALQDPEGGR